MLIFLNFFKSFFLWPQIIIANLFLLPLSKPTEHWFYRL